MPWKYKYLSSPPYLSELSQIPELGVAIMLLSLLLITLHKKPSFAWLMILVMLISGAAIDRFKIVTKLYENSYGPDFPEPKVISHYSIVELDAAKYLGNFIDTSKSPLWLLISDPYTLSIGEAVTGVNGFYTFSNIGNMKREYEDNLKAIFRNIFPRLNNTYDNDRAINNYADENRMIFDKRQNILKMLAEFVEKNMGAMPEAQYFSCVRFGQPLNSELFKKKLIWVINEKTVEWAYRDVGYYPLNKKFSRRYMEKYILPYFDIIMNYDDRVLALKVK